MVVVHGLSSSEARGIFLDQGLNSCLLHWKNSDEKLRDRAFKTPFYDKNVNRHTHPIPAPHLALALISTEVKTTDQPWVSRG